MNFSRNKIFNLKVFRIKLFISGFRPNPIEHRAKTGRLHCLLHSFSVSNCDGSNSDVSNRDGSNRDSINRDSSNRDSNKSDSNNSDIFK